MAFTSSTTIWNTKTTYDYPASKISCYFNNNNSFSTKPLRFTAYSSDSSSLTPSSSSSSSCSTSSCSCSTYYYAATSRYIRNQKSPENERTHDVTFSIVHIDGSNKFEQKINKAKAHNSLKRGLKAIAKKRPLWRKFWFSSKRMRSIILLNVITIVYASDIPIVKGVEMSMDPATFSAVRFVVSAIPFLPFVFRARDDIKTRNAGMELGLWVSLGYLIEAIGLLTADAGRASFISLFTVIVVPLLDGILGAYIPARTWFGVLMSTLGVAMLECSGSPPSVGDLLNFLSAIFFGIHMLRTEHISRSTKKENFLPLLGYEMAAMRDVSATETAIIYGLEPLWGAGFAWFLLGERWGMSGWIGAALVLGGSLMVQMFGSLPVNKPIEVEEANQKGNLLLVPEKQKVQSALSTSPVVVRTKKDVIDLL
ncbi:hypothetical protein ACB092_04G093900 [Castanea dentata]